MKTPRELAIETTRLLKEAGHEASCEGCGFMNNGGQMDNPAHEPDEDLQVWNIVIKDAKGEVVRSLQVV